MIRAAAALAAATLLLAGCQSRTEPAEDGDDAALFDDGQDAAVTGVLADNILVDPDLGDQSNRNAAIAPVGEDAVPSETLPAGALAAQRDAAKVRIGPRGLMHAPAARTDAAAGRGPTLGAIAAARPHAADCADKIAYRMDWASRMPAPFAVYPRANLKEAAGVETAQCDIRAVNFTTAVPVGEVIDFYYTLARRAGYSAQHETSGDEHVLGGGTPGQRQAYVVFARPRANGGSDVDIVTTARR